MKRHVLGVLAASATAPYLVGAFLFVGAMSGSLNVASPSPPGDVLSFWGVILALGTYGILAYGIPVLIAAAVAAAAIKFFDLNSPKTAVGLGFTIGLGFGLFVLPSEIDTAWLVSFALSGTASGWVYWRIAIRQTPDGARPITTP